MSDKHSEGSFLLKTVSFDLMFFGIVAIIYAIIDLTKTNTADTNWLTATILVLIASVLELIFGWIGFRKSDDKGHANYFVVTGVIMALIMIVSIFICYTVWGLVGFLLPVFYIIGGSLYRRFED